MASAAEIQSEQQYFDRAAEARERAKAAAGNAPGAAAHASAAAQLAKYAKAHRDALGATGSAVAHGRIDLPGEDPLYIGKHLISDRGHHGVLVISWTLPAAQPYYKATHADPLGLTRRRTFHCTGNTIDDCTDVVFAAAVPEGPPGPDAALLRALAEGRTGNMRDIVATIQAAQYDVIQASLDSVLVIEGGPGSGKTAVALHRVSWLLVNHADRLRAAGVLVVGPHPTFTRYISTVLPDLGEQDVVQRDITQLGPTVKRGRPEPVALSRIKGQARMAGLLARAIRQRIGRPEPAERLQLDGRFVTLPGAEIGAAVADLHDGSGPYAQRRAQLRDVLTAMLERRGFTAAQARQRSVDNLLERLWPQLSAQAFVRDLFSSLDRLRSAAGDAFTAAEVAQLRRRSADRLSEQIWSRDDLPLLDEADFLINGRPADRYGHIVVDEAQDLSPMQLRAIARRSATGSLTVLGDLAQSTGPWARDSWDDVTAHLPGTHPRTVTQLRYGYRVPRQVYEFAALLLPLAAPRSVPTEVVRDGPRPGIHRVEAADRAGRAVAIAQAHAAERRFVGIICPPTCRADVEAALAANDVAWSSADRGELGNAINLVSPQESKGLKFDAVVVVEPADIVAGDEHGHRMLYVAFTRTTGHLDVVCVGEPLPMHLVAPEPALRPPAPAIPALEPVAVARLAGEIAERVRRQTPSGQWDEVLAEAARLLRD
ncbi:HelD family protein [Dactylosporangium sp. CS-047395]|uniref:HelD family protein n=1 Tax=Dactylosporangium sp. CS-047395 TaxID=3239936 RepID=UPI003D8E5C09